jgi:pimeloyl-ACP methyl ester carboxylesterase
MNPVLIIITAAAVIILFVIIAGPVQSARLAKRYAKFRAEHQAEHDAVDAQFNHNDVQLDGINWHYVDYGAKDGPAVLFLHGLPEGWYSWRYVMPLVDAKYRLIVPDMKGYGRSSAADSDYNWHTVARQTVALMDHLKITKFYVVGHDWGSLIGSVLVDDHQDRVLGFVRMEADFVPDQNRGRLKGYLQKPQWLLFRMTWFARLFMRDVARFIDIVYVHTHHTRWKEEDRNYFICEFSRPRVAHQVPLYFQQRNWDTNTALDKFCKNRYNFPVMALQADHDLKQPASLFERAAEECPCVELRWIKDAGHFDNLEQPAQVAAAINDFLERSKTWKRECA